MTGAAAAPMTPAHVALPEVAKQHPGRARAIKWSEVQMAMLRYGLGLSQLREIREDLLKVHGEPIGSTLDGIYYCVTDDDYAAAERTYRVKVRGLVAAVVAFRRIRYARLSGQEAFAFAGSGR
jgi:hypothetical protein